MRGRKDLGKVVLVLYFPRSVIKENEKQELKKARKGFRQRLVLFSSHSLDTGPNSSVENISEFGLDDVKADTLFKFFWTVLSLRQKFSNE